MKYFLVLLVGFIFASSHAAEAHPRLKSSMPKENSTVKELPKIITLIFSEELMPSMSKLEVSDDKGHPVAIEAVPDNSNRNALEYSFRDKAEGKATYTVSWKAVSKDTHKIKGNFKFSVDPKAK